ncbi:MAG: SIMPL domain-containing protein [Nitrososphaerota archaeon]
MSDVKPFRGDRFASLAIVVSVVAIAAVLAISLYAMNMVGASEREGGTPLTQQTGEGQQTGIVVPVRGVGVIKLRPDKLSFSLGVEARGETPTEAATQNSEVMSRVISSLLANGVKEENIKTSYVAINPYWECDANGCRQTGYTAVNQVTVTLEDNAIANSPKIIHDAIQAGATSLYGAWFDLKDETKKSLRDSALQLAFSDALSKASKIAEYLNMKVAAVKEIHVSFPDEAGLPIIYAARAATGAVPLEATSGMPIMTGEITYTVTVDITYLFEKTS